MRLGDESPGARESAGRVAQRHEASARNTTQLSMQAK